MNRTIKVREVETYLPHRPPMVWIDEVLSFSEKQGHCRLQLKADALYLNETGLRSTSLIEFIAQAYGYISACHHYFILDRNSKPLSKAFLASIKNAKMPTEEILETLKVGDELFIAIDRVRQLGPIVSFRGIVTHNEKVICEASMKIFKEYQA